MPTFLEPPTPTILPSITCQKQAVDTSPESFGELRSSIDVLDDVAELRRRMVEDGYLYLPQYLNRDDVLAARRTITDQLAAEGLLDPAYPSMDGIAKAEVSTAWRPDLARGNKALQKVLFSGRQMDFYNRFLGGTARHLDFIWLRVNAQNNGVHPHCDIVYMGRGTHKLYTAWVPYGDVPYGYGGLMLLENSHRLEGKLKNYLNRDVDDFCLNGADAEQILSGKKQWHWDGSLSRSPVSLRKKLGGRWLTAEFRVGDVVTFGMSMVHTSADNPTRRIRISSDTRYQLASEKVDERWIGENPPANGVSAKRGRIC